MATHGIRGALVGVLFVLLLPALSGCGDEPPGRDATDVTDAVAGRRGGTAVIALQFGPDVLNPLIRTTSTAGRIHSVLADPLLEMKEDLSWEPRIARTYAVAADGLSVTYVLRPWHWADGTPLTAHDVVRSLELFKDPLVASPRRGFFADVTAATALDDSTVRYDFATAVADPLSRTYHEILPAHVVGDLDPADVANWPLNTAPLSSGPFVLEAWERNRQLVLVRNPDYPGRPPLLERVVFRILPEAETRILALEAGEVDLVDQVSPTDAARLERGGRATIHAVGGRQIYYVQWNTRRPAFADAATRRALSLAIDRERMIATLVAGYARPAASPVAPVVWNHHGDLAADPHDPARARSLLAAAGWRDDDGDGILERQGRPLRIEMLTKQGDPVRENGAVILRENLRDVGAEVIIRVLELGVAIDRLDVGRFDAYFGLMNLNLYGDPSSLVHSDAVDRFNKGAFANAEVDSLLGLALATRDRAAARPYWQLLQEVLQEDPPAAWLFYPQILVGVGPRLRDVRPHMLSPYNNLAEWWIDPADRRYRSGG